MLRLPIWIYALNELRPKEPKRMGQIAIATAFAFFIMMFNVPISGGSAGVVVGGTIIALLG